MSGLACPMPLSAAHARTAEATVTENQAWWGIGQGRAGGVQGGFGPLSSALEWAADH